jgi:AhpD family alkylhydroperoxidase
VSTTIAPLEPDGATGQAAELLGQVKKSLGLVPTMTKVMANSPALLKGYLALNGAIAGGKLPAAVRERLAIATAQRNGCEYCLSAHTYVGANLAKVDGDELDAARRAESNDRTSQRCWPCRTRSPRPPVTSVTKRSRPPGPPG